MSVPHDEPLLAAFFRPYIKNQFKNQAEFAQKLEIKPSLLSNYLNGKRPVPLEVIAAIAKLTKVPLRTAVLASCAARVQREAKSSSPENKGVREEAARELKSLLEGIGNPPTPVSDCRISGEITLANFPAIVPGDWKVVMGDRRESPPQGLGDLAVLSSSCSDVMFLPGLKLPPGTTVLSDKIFRLVPDEEELRDILQCNILCIGSPAVCLATRKILSKMGATFPFNISEADYEKDEKLLNAIPKSERHDPEALDKFKHNPDLQGTVERLLKVFHASGFVDPVNFAGIRGGGDRNSNFDYGVIALARNPWSERHVVCICAGIHAAGTAGAVEMLGKPQEFERRPWGGVLKVQVADQARWEHRFEHLRPKWETHEYDAASYFSNLSQLLASLKQQESNTKEGAVPSEIQLKVPSQTIANVKSFVEKQLMRP